MTKHVSPSFSRVIASLGKRRDGNPHTSRLITSMLLLQHLLVNQAILASRFLVYANKTDTLTVVTAIGHCSFNLAHPHGKRIHCSTSLATGCRHLLSNSWISA